MDEPRVEFHVTRGTLWSCVFLRGKAPVDATDPDGVAIPDDPEGRYYVPDNITGAGLKMQFREYEGAALEYELDLTDGLSIPSPTLGKIQLYKVLERDDWSVGIFEFALEITIDNAPEIVCKGLLHVDPEITV